MAPLVELSDQCSDIQKRTAPKQAKLRVFTQSGGFLLRLYATRADHKYLTAAPRLPILLYKHRF
jgi:hypothetical protein